MKMPREDCSRPSMPGGWRNRKCNWSREGKEGRSERWAWGQIMKGSVGYCKDLYSKYNC